MPKGRKNKTKNQNSNLLSGKLGALVQLNEKHPNVAFYDLYTVNEEIPHDLRGRQHSALNNLSTILDKLNNTSNNIAALQHALGFINFHQKKLNEYCDALSKEIVTLTSIHSQFVKLVKEIKASLNANPKYTLKKKNKAALTTAESNIEKLKDQIEARAYSLNFVTKKRPKHPEQQINNRIEMLEKNATKADLHESVNKYLAARAIKYGFLDTLDSIICTIAACFNPEIKTEKSKREDYAKELKAKISTYIDHKNDTTKNELIAKLDSGIGFFKPRSENDGKGSFKEVLTNLKNRIG